MKRCTVRLSEHTAKHLKRAKPLKRREQGFTLIELLIALGVMAVFALLAYRGLDSVLRLHQGAATHEAQAQAVDRVITQLEADLRQASSARIVAPMQTDGAARLQLQRRMEGAASGELATVEWVLTGNTLTRVARLSTGVQTAELLSPAAASNSVATASTPVTALSWLSFSLSANGTAQWMPIDPAVVLAQSNQSLAVQRGLGLRLTVAGKPLEKLFLLGR